MRNKVAILGASGIIGQQFARILATHPLFELTSIYGNTTAGKLMKEVWGLPGFVCPPEIADLEIEPLDTDIITENLPDIVFSALPSSIANKFEHNLRLEGKKVFSNSSTHRMDQDVPILIPEINASHLKLVKYQQQVHGSEGYIVTNSNCSAAGSAVYLAELKKIIPSFNHGVITTYQAVSGAGLKGVSAIEIGQNVIPFINNEEPKIIAETQKMIGEYKKEADSITPFSFDLVANAARVPVIDGHLEAITIFSDDIPEYDEVLSHFNSIKSPLDRETLHTAPKKHIRFTDFDNRPQPKLDVFSSENTASQGMVVHIGRIRRTDTSISAYVLVHNTIRGGAGGSVLNAEFAIQQGY